MPLTDLSLGRITDTSVGPLAAAGHPTTGDPALGHAESDGVPPWIHMTVLPSSLGTRPSPVALTCRKGPPSSSDRCTPPQNFYRRCYMVGIPCLPYCRYFSSVRPFQIGPSGHLGPPGAWTSVGSREACYTRKISWPASAPPSQTPLFVPPLPPPGAIVAP